MRMPPKHVHRICFDPRPSALFLDADATKGTGCAVWGVEVSARCPNYRVRKFAKMLCEESIARLLLFTRTGPAEEEWSLLRVVKSHVCNPERR